VRRLLLLRHAKAVPATGRDDHERALLERGRRDAERIGAFVAAISMIPDLMIDSGAVRTRETATLVSEAWPQPVEARAEPGLYEASRHVLQHIVRALPDAARDVMLVAHNPGLADLANHLVGKGARDEMLRMAGKFPTAGLAILEFEIEHWRDLEPGSGLLARFVTPDDPRVAQG
jgi:phosphohistidine phosphatase